MNGRQSPPKSTGATHEGVSTQPANKNGVQPTASVDDAPPLSTVVMGVGVRPVDEEVASVGDDDEVASIDSDGNPLAPPSPSRAAKRPRIQSPVSCDMCYAMPCLHVAHADVFADARAAVRNSSKTNKQARYFCYTTLAERAGFVGKRSRLPDCTTTAVRAAFPDANGQYVGYSSI